MANSDAPLVGFVDINPYTAPLELARQEVRVAYDSGDTLRRARATRELAHLAHLAGLASLTGEDIDDDLPVTHKKAPRSLRESKSLFKESLALYERHLATLQRGSDDLIRCKAEFAETLGMYGQTVYDSGYLQVLISKYGFPSRHSFRKRRYARLRGMHLLEKAYAILEDMLEDSQLCEQQEYETLLRLIECLPFNERRVYRSVAARHARELNRNPAELRNALRGRRVVIRKILEPVRRAHEGALGLES